MSDAGPLDNQLARELRKLGQEPAPDSLATEQAVLTAFRRRQRRIEVPAWIWAAVAAGLFLTFGAAAWWAGQPAEPERQATAPSASAERTTPFYVLDPLGPGVLGGRGRLVRLSLPPGEGFAGRYPPAGAAGGALHADVLLGDDGVPNAFRFVY